MTPLVLLGAGVGLGLFLIGRGVLPAPTPLSTAFARLARIGRSVADERAAAHGATRSDALAARMSRLVSGRLGDRVESDLAVMERSAQRFALEKVTTAVALGLVVVAFAVIVAAGGSPIGGGITFVLTVCAVAIGFVTPDLTLKAQAGRRRAAFRQALSSYLDLVNVLLAGGAGIETSLEAAAEAGDGWAFTQIRNALVRARTLRQSPWECFVELGRVIQVDELSEIAASVKLAGQQGARVKLSLAARAATLRGHQMAAIEAAAQSATERMGLPTVLMFVGFIGLLGYPAVQQIVTTL
jgi:Flp pilus assembly protein TadB